MKRRFLSSIVVAVVLLLILYGSQQAFGQSEVSGEEYAVYSAVIAEMYAGSKMKFDTNAVIKQLVIKDRTTTNGLGSHISADNWKYLRMFFPAMTQEAADEFTAKNKEEHHVTDKFKIDLSHTLIKQEELYKIFNKTAKDGIIGTPEGWENFYKLYPDSGGYVIFSRTGFNPQKTQALVYMEQWCRSLCGTGHYLLLENSEGKWKVAKKYMAWVS